MQEERNTCPRCNGTGVDRYQDHGFANHGEAAIEAICCQLCDGFGWVTEEDTPYYRWVLINNQETCYCRVVKLLTGFFKTAEDVKEHYEEQYCFKEHLFGVKPLEFSETPKWLAEKTGEFVK